jgi:hypothetical protein
MLARLALALLALMPGMCLAQGSALQEKLVAGSPWELKTRWGTTKMSFRISSEGRLEQSVNELWRPIDAASERRITWKSRDGHLVTLVLTPGGDFVATHETSPWVTFTSIK